MTSTLWTGSRVDRQYFVGGSDARIIMGDDEAALLRLWREKRGEVEPEDLSGNLIVQLGVVTEELNRRWYEANTGRVITDVQQWARHPALPLDGGDPRWPGRGSARCSRASSCCRGRSRRRRPPRSICRSCSTICGSWRPRAAVLSVITGGGKWVEIKTHADPLYQHLIVTAERKFWRCVESGEPPALFGVEPPKPRIEAVRIVDMSSSNAWAEFAAVFSRTRSAHLEHEQAKAELKSLDAGGCPAGDRPWRAGQALEIGRHQFRPPRAWRAAMQRSSGSIGSLAAALAKAKANSSIRRSRWSRPSGRMAQAGPSRPFAMRRCRAGSTSCARSLGQHEIATVQTTSIDQAAGIINLTTVLAHASGEWIASDWPVCAISETATPHRMGAALTYARRYALFTLVGIAGEDDLDAPDLTTPTNRTPGPEKSKDNTNSRLNGGQHKRYATSAQLVRRPTDLEAEASAELRDRLLDELKELGSSDDAAMWAHRSR